ncbi:MAG: aspartate aminotransferase family protein [Gemmatimonadetes bacterium]|nr:aspartate aminotransferase family protein [Gemmatimonadota bacterium]MYB98979.1 aspartate aminotransferase family protein [Gemmatimonadota bacterium]MYI45553.1 aspartate aminotransferase family protein [Gemmatimonadota bacterium]
MPPEKGPDDGSREQWAARLSRVESRNVTFLESLPPFWTHAAGAAVRDASGRTYLDFSGAFGVALAGHRHGLIADRIREQAGRLVHGMGDIHPPAIKVEFLEALAALLPWRSPRTILGLSGSDAVEAALKTAHLATGRPGIVAFEGSYHGLTLGALAATDRDHFRRPFTSRLADHVRFVPFPSSPGEGEAVLDQVSELLAGKAPVPAGAVIVEPIQGRAGVRIPPDDFLAELGKRTREGGALLVADEIFTGMGRTGSLFGCDHDGVVPDLICLGKALGGGMPLSACCGPREVMDAWPPSTGEAVHTSTFLGHPLSCAGGLAFLAVLEAHDLAGCARRLGDQALGYLKAELDGCERVAEVRGRGLMLGVELRQRGGAAPGAEAAAQALEQGLIVLPAGASGEVVELTPPATLTRRELEAGLQILVGAIRSAG